MRVMMWLSIGLDRRTPSEHLLNAIIESLYKQGHTVHILQKSTGGDKPPLTPVMQRLHVTTTCIEIKTATKNNFFARYAADILYVNRCRGYLMENHWFDRVFMQSSNVAGQQVQLLTRYMPGVPILFNVQDIFPENAVYSRKLSEGSIVYRLLAKMQHKAYNAVDRIITISEDMKDQLIEAGTPADKIHVIYNWSYQDAAYDPVSTRADAVDALISDAYFNVVYAGNIGFMQNVEVIVRAAEILKDQQDIRFYVIGDGLYRKSLEDYATVNGLTNILFHDMFPSDCAPAIYCRADVNVIPLADNIYRTALPSKTATCLACQKPIILAIGTYSIFARMLNNKTGAAVIDSNDCVGLAKAITCLRSGKVSYQSSAFFQESFQISQNSQKYAELITS